MKFILDDHARAACTERDIQLFEIRYALLNYYLSSTTSSGSTMLLSEMPHQHILKLFIEGRLPLREPVIVKTACWKGIEDGSTIDRNYR